MPWGAAIGAVAGLASAGIGAASSGKAAGKASDASNLSAAQQLAQWQFTAAQESPFVEAGRQALGDVTGALSKWGGYEPASFRTALGNVPNVPGPITMTQADLEATPGYQFTRDQGLKSVQNSAAAKGLGISGAALKGAARFATGLADTTYNTRFQQALQQQQALFGNQQQRFADYMTQGSADQQNVMDQFNRLYNLSSLGQNAVTQTGAQGVAASGNAGNSLMQGGAAQAAGIQGVGNALSGGLTNVGNTLQRYLIYNNQPTQLAPQFAPGGYPGGVQPIGMGGIF